MRTTPLAILGGLLQLSAAAPGNLLNARGYHNSSWAEPAKTYAACQKNTCHPLEGCPKGTIYVSKDESKYASFSSIQAAIASLPHDNSAHVILIAPGNYTEQLNVTRPGPLTLLGVSDDPVHGAAYGSAASGDTSRSNGVTVLWADANADSTATGKDNTVTSVLTVAPTYNASLTGSGPTGFPVPADTPFGNTDFRAYNIDFRNVFSQYSAGPSLAVGVSYANAGFYGCGFYSYQDTIYIGKLGNAYFYDNVIAGQTDFLYGFGTAWIEKSLLALRSCGGGITAWKGTNTTFVNKYGVYISETNVLAANSSIATAITHKCALGRPWNALHHSVFMGSYFDNSILPAGYIKWSTTDPRYGVNTTMAVYNDRGPGYNVTAEVASNVTLVFDAQQVKPYESPLKVFITPNGTSPNVAWIDASVYKH